MPLTIYFEDGTAAERNKHAQMLLQCLREALPKEVTVERERDDPNAQDMGATLVIAVAIAISHIALEVSSKAIAEILKDYVAKGITHFRLRSAGRMITIDTNTTPDELIRTLRSALDPSAGSSAS